MLKQVVLAVVLIWNVMAVAATAGAEEDPGTYFANTWDSLVTVRDIKPLLPPLAELTASDKIMPDEPKAKEAVKTLLDKLGQMINGRACMAFETRKTATDELQEPVFCLLRVPVDESKFKIDDLIDKNLVQALGAKDVAVSKESPVRELRWRIKVEELTEKEKEIMRAFRIRGGASKDLPVREPPPQTREVSLFWGVQNGILYVSNERKQIPGTETPAAAGSSEAKPAQTASLAADALYRSLGKYVNWTGDVTMFGSGKKQTPHMYDDLAILSRDGARWLYDWIRPDQLQASGFSWTGDGKSGSGRLAVLVPKERAGLAGLFDSPNAPIGNLNFIPQNVQFFAFAAPGWRGLIERFGKFMAGLDPEAGKEFRDKVAEFNKDLGVGLGKDLLDNLGPITLGAQMPGAGALGFYGIAEVKDAAALQKAADALANYNKTPLKKVNRAGRSYTLLPTTPVVGYTADVDLLYFSNTFEAIEEMLVLSKPRTGYDEDLTDLSQSEQFKKLLARLPKENMAVGAMDMQWLGQFLFAGMTLMPELRKNVPQAALTELGRIFAPFEKAGPGLSVGAALRNEPDAFVLHIESPSVDLWRLAPNGIRAAQAFIAGEEPAKPKPAQDSRPKP